MKSQVIARSTTPLSRTWPRSPAGPIRSLADDDLVAFHERGRQSDREGRILQ